MEDKWGSINSHLVNNTNALLLAVNIVCNSGFP